jgi:hypothetical protein
MFERHVGMERLKKEGWNYGREFVGRLGLSNLQMSEVDCFLKYHAENRRRVSNAVRLSGECSYQTVQT